MQTPYIILGSAITANFMYPIVSLDRLMPNPKKECIIFTNTQGYQRINDAFRSSEVESYFVAKFNNNETQSNKDTILNNINDYGTNPIRPTMMYPSNIKIAYMNNDTNNVLSPAALRIAFIPRLINELSIVDTVLTVFILLLSVLICIFVINNYINKKRVEIGIMRANGVRRRKIVFSLIPFALLPAIIGGVMGYFIGFLLQAPTLGLFHNY
jgi:putative ABC transport system permease protein